MRKCPNCGAEANYGGQLLKCENCGSTYCIRCINNCGGGCVYCGSPNSKSF